VLQAYALQETVKGLGFQTEIIDYVSEARTERVRARRHTRLSDVKNIRQLAAFVLYRVFLEKKYARRAKEFEAFFRDEYSLSKPCGTAEQLREIASEYASVIVGSDQVWSPRYSAGDLAYLLDFVSGGTKRVSYAASFGVSELPVECHDDYKNHLGKFNHLAVREIEGKRIVNDLLSREADVVLDPTLLRDATQWNTMRDSAAAMSRPYILYYTLGHNPTLNKIAGDMKKKLRLPMISVVGGGKDRDNFNRKADQIIFKGPKTFLQLMSDASFLLTNSFHGTAFAINYQKPFLVAPNLYPSRIQSILGMLKLENRMVSDPRTVSSSLYELDYREPSALLQQHREASLQFLKNALSAGGR